MTLSFSVLSPVSAGAPAPLPIGCVDLGDGVSNEAGSIHTCLGMRKYIRQGEGGISPQQQYAAVASSSKAVFPPFNRERTFSATLNPKP